MKDSRNSSHICFLRCVILTVIITILASVSFAESVNVHDISGGGGGTVTNSWHISEGLSPGGGQLAHKITLHDGINIIQSIDAYSFDSEHPQPFTHKNNIYAISDTNITLSHDIIIREGYELSYTVDGARISGNEFVMPNNDVVIGAVNVPVVYEMSYDLSGGGVESANPLCYTVESDDFKLKRPERVGYDFAGWIGEGLTEASKDLTIPRGSTGNRKYTATWTLTIYGISYDLNGGEADNPAEYSVESNTFTLNNPTRNGYTFIGWIGTGIEGSSASVEIPNGSTGAREYTATFTPITYNITYNLDGGSATNPTSYNIETTSFTLNNPTKEGYTFTGWTGTGIEGSSSSVTIVKGSTGNRTYTATFMPITYTITYNLNGGNATNPASYDIESDTFKLNNPTKDGYTFVGWTGTGINGTSSSVTIAKGLTGTRTYTATFTPITYAITYKLDGGMSISNPSSYTIESGDIHIHSPVKYGYDFIGWSYDGIISEDLTIPQNSSGDIELKALWHLHTYTISYDLHGGITSSDNPTSYTIESEDFTLINPERPCYVFMGWAGSADIESSMDVTIRKGSTENRSYFASWRPITYAISYDLKGGYVSPDNPASYNIESEAFKLTNPDREGYIFMGWTGTGLTEASSDIIIPSGSSGDRKYTATWKAITFTLNYDLQGGILTADNPLSYDIETESFTLNNPVRGAYMFVGWTGTGLDAPAMSVTISKGSTGARNYTALWEAVTYKISYTLNGANDPDNPTSYSVESDDIALKNPTRNGYTFSGWTGTGLTAKTQAVTIPAGSSDDREYTAHFTPINYAITYTLNGGKAENSSSYTIETNAFTLNNPERAGYVFTGWTSISDGITEPQNIVSIGRGSTGDKDFTATWSAKVYEISYDLDGGTFSGEYVAYYTTESGDVKLKTPIKNSYEFIGWSVEGEEGISEDITIPGGSMNDRKYVANWKPKEYSLTYNLDGGSVSPDNPSRYTVETEAFTLNKPIKAGYIFSGWTGTSLDAETITVTILQGSTGNREYSAHFTPIIYALSYDLNGGISPGNPTSYTVESNDIQLLRPTRTGYDFKGWSFDGGVSLDVLIPHGSIGSREFKALWVVHEYTISYDLNGGISPGNHTSYTVESSDIQLSPPTRTGYDFKGWSFDGGVSLDVTIPRGSIGIKEFKALWAVHVYEISYNLNGGTATGNPTNYTIETPSFTLNNPAKNGYTFSGWTGTSLDPHATTVTISQGSSGNRTYTARFTPVTYSITYNLDGGTFPHDSPESYDIESRTLTLSNPTKPGFIFTGWTGSGLDEPQITVTIPQGSTGNRIYTANYEEAQEDYPPEITAESFTLNAHKGLPASLTFSASSREIPQWTLIGTLPEGLTFTASDYSAEISGIPETGTSGRYAVSITATNSAGTSSADILIHIAGYSELSSYTRNTHTAIKDNSGNLILSADIAIIVDSYDISAECGKTLTINASIDTTLELYDSDYDTYIYSLDMAGLPQWLNVSGEITSHDVITAGASYHHHALTLSGIPESSHNIDDITLTAIVKVSGDIPALVAQYSRDIHISVKDSAPEITDASDDVTPKIPGNVILSADVDIITSADRFTAICGESLDIPASVEARITINDSDYDTYIYSLDVAGLPEWLNVSGDVSFVGAIVEGESILRHEFMIHGMPSSPGIYDARITAHVKISGDITALEVSADKDITISAQAQAHVLRSLDVSITSGDSTIENVSNVPPVINASSYELTITAGVAISPITITALEGVNITWTHEGSLPEGLSLTHDNNSMTISGTVSKNAGTGQYTFTAKATNDSGHDEATITFNVIRQPAITAGNVELSLSDFATMTENEIAEILGGSEAVTVEGFAGNIGEVIAKIDRSANVKHVDLSNVEGVNEIELDSLSSIESINLSGNNSATHITITHSNSLRAIDLSASNVITVNLNACPNLESVNVMNCEHLETFNASSCALEEFETGGCVNLREIDICFNRLRRFDALGLENLMSLEDGGQSVNVDEIGARLNMLSFVEGDISASGSVNDFSAENVKNLKAYDISGNEIQSTYDSVTGEAIFDSAPAVVTYDYVTGFRDDLMDVTISGIKRGNEIEIEQAESKGGGGCLNMKLILCAAVVIVLLFVKGGIKN